VGVSERRDVERLAVPVVGDVVATDDAVVPVVLRDAHGAEVRPVSEFLRDVRACGGSAGTARSYALALLRWFRFLCAAGVAWDRAGRAEARDFMLWLEVVAKPARGRSLAVPAQGLVNSVTRKPVAGSHYAVRTRRHNRAVVRAFYEYHREAGRGPLVNPMPARRGPGGGRPDAHHDPMMSFVPGRRADFQPKLPRQQPRGMPDAAFDALFVGLSSNRDRALVAFYISTAARASELLGVTCDRVDVGQQLIGVIRKGSGALQWLPASADAFVWLLLYQQRLPGHLARGPGDPLWRTLRAPHGPLRYPAARAVLGRVNTVLGTNWSLHDLRHTAARRFITDPALTLPDVQWLLGHAHITTTQLYLSPPEAVYPEDVITAHRAFIARRRSLRPSAEYRELTPGEWEEFIGHFELRKVELGVCTRDFGTPCVHEHVPLTELTGARVGPAAPVGADRRQPPRPDSRGTRQRLERRSRRPGGQRRRSRAEAAADRRTDRPAHRDLPRYA